MELQIFKTPTNFSYSKGSVLLKKIKSSWSLRRTYKQWKKWLTWSSCIRGGQPFWKVHHKLVLHSPWVLLWCLFPAQYTTLLSAHSPVLPARSNALLSAPRCMWHCAVSSPNHTHRGCPSHFRAHMPQVGHPRSVSPRDALGETGLEHSSPGYNSTSLTMRPCLTFTLWLPPSAK